MSMKAKDNGYFAPFCLLFDIFRTDVHLPYGKGLCPHHNAAHGQGSNVANDCKFAVAFPVENHFARTRCKKEGKSMVSSFSKCEQKANVCCCYLIFLQKMCIIFNSIRYIVEKGKIISCRRFFYEVRTV